MGGKWTKEEFNNHKIRLTNLYIDQNLTINEIGKILRIKPNSVYDRLIKVGITTSREKKVGFNNQRTDIIIPQASKELAEFIGIMLGDGHITPTQITVTLGIKEGYTEHVSKLIKLLFKIEPRVLIRQNKYNEIYFGSTMIVRWLIGMGLAHNKVLSQVSIPKEFINNSTYHKSLIRGLIDTDGSIYKTKSGLQISFTNKSTPLLKDIQYMLRLQGFSPSKISVNKVYLTKNEDIKKYVSEIGFNNPKHLNRYIQFKA